MDWLELKLVHWVFNVLLLIMVVPIEGDSDQNDEKDFRFIPHQGKNNMHHIRFHF